MNTQKFRLILTSNGYSKKGYGYTKVCGPINHWVTLFDSKIQMYSYHIDDPELEKQYDTGMIKPTTEELEILIKIFN